VKGKEAASREACEGAGPKKKGYENKKRRVAYVKGQKKVYPPSL
jgi:hypothetical protein